MSQYGWLLCLLLASGGVPSDEAIHATETRPVADNATRAQLRRYYFDAARQGRVEVMREFIAAQWDLNLQDDKGYTALILAAYHGHAPLVQQLLAAGANPCLADQRGNTAMMGAIFKGEVSIARQLMTAPCAVDQRNHAGQTAAMYAALFQRKEILEALLRQGADARTQDARGNSVQQLKDGKFGSGNPP